MQFFRSGMGQGGTRLSGSPSSSTIPKRKCSGLAFSNHKSWSKKASAGECMHHFLLLAVFSKVVWDKVAQAF
jgi:hypothetical protein